MQIKKLNINDSLYIKCLLNYFDNNNVYLKKHEIIHKTNNKTKITISNVFEFFDYFYDKQIIINLGSANWIDNNVFQLISNKLNNSIEYYKSKQILNIPNIVDINLDIEFQNNEKSRLPQYGYCYNCPLNFLCTNNEIGGEKIESKSTNFEKCNINRLLLNTSSIFQFEKIKQIELANHTYEDYLTVKSIQLIQQNL